MSGLIIFIIVVVALWLVWPTVTRWIRAWVMRKLQRRAEDYMRAAAGMPPREEAKRSRRGSKEQRRGAASGDTERGYAGRRRRAQSRGDEPLIPKEYAVDVEYVEIKEYSESVTIGADSKAAETREWHESQVTDVEWIEIKNHAS